MLLRYFLNKIFCLFMFYAVSPSDFARQTVESTSVNVKTSVMENSKLSHYLGEL